MRIPELLAPVASLDYLKVAINAGASSVYLSGKDYGARKYAKNFTLDEIEKAVDISHLHNVRVYVTVNTLIKEDEISEVLDYLSKLHSIGVDAVLVQDLGLVDLIRKYLPDLKIHASTQMTIENQHKLDYIESKGIRRVVLPREMTKEEISSLKTNMELEIFVHGALCYSYSGQCLMSSFNGGRSGNRGACAQPCRQKYKIKNLKKEDYYLSPCDLSLFNNLKEIQELNIRCIKIEGRMRSKEYLAIVVNNYRKALNKLKSSKKLESEEINLVFNRGFTQGKFNNKYKRSLKSGHIGLKIGEVIKTNKNQIAIRLDDKIKNIPQKGDGLLILKQSNSYGFEISQNPIITTLNHFKKDRIKQVKDLTRENKVLIVKKVWQNKKSDFNLNESDVYLTKRNNMSKKVVEIENKSKSFIKSKLILTFSLKNKFPHLKGRITLLNKKIIECEVVGDKAFEKPLRKTITPEIIKKQLLKVDNYPFDITQININYDGTLYTPISKINKLRRKLFEKISSEIAESYKNPSKKIRLNTRTNETGKNEINLSYYTNNLDDLRKIENVERVYLEIPPFDNSLDISNENYNLKYMIDFLGDAFEISKTKKYSLIWKWPDITHDKLIKVLNKVKAILAKKNIVLPIMSNNFKSPYCSYAMNITNSSTLESLENYEKVTLSPELSKKDYENIIKHAKNPKKIEILVQGSVELMKTRYPLLNKKELEKNYEPVLIDLKNNEYSIYKSISNEELIIFSDCELSLLGEINYLKKIGFSNFAIDGRFKGENYHKMINIYNNALNGNINEKELLKLSPNNSVFNYK